MTVMSITKSMHDSDTMELSEMMRTRLFGLRNDNLQIAICMTDFGFELFVLGVNVQTICLTDDIPIRLPEAARELGIIRQTIF